MRRLPASVSPGTATDAVPHTPAIRPAAAGRLTTITAQIDRERRQQAMEQEERCRIEAAVHLLDEAIEACEREHLGDEKKATPELLRQARAAVEAATAASCLLADPAPITSQAGRLSRTCLRITEVMDAVWEVLDIFLDLQVPGCRAIYDAVGPEMPISPVSTRCLRLLAAAPAPRGCAYCGRRCDQRDAAGVRFCSTDHLLRARRHRLVRTTAVADAEAFSTSMGA